MIVLGLDPGPERSGWALWNGAVVVGCGVAENDDISTMRSTVVVQHVACEWIENYGMAVGREVLDTCRWVGRFQERAERGGCVAFHLVTRRSVKLHLCGSFRANDSNIRQALLDRFGGKTTALGSKRAPGPLYSVKSHAWSALAVAICWAETEGK